MNNKIYITLLLMLALTIPAFDASKTGIISAAEALPELLPEDGPTAVYKKDIKKDTQKQAVKQEKQAQTPQKSDVKQIMNITPVSNTVKANKDDLNDVTKQNLDKKALEKKLKEEKKLAKQAEKQAKQEAKTKAAVNKKDDKKAGETKDSKNGDKNEISARELKRIEKKKEEYKEYLIPTDSYMPVGNIDDRSTKITGSIQKTLEFNLADCLELALINHPRIKAAYANASAQKAVKNQTLSNYSPRVNIDAGISRIKPDTSAMSGLHSDSYTKYLLGTIGVSQLVYDFGTTQNQYTIDKLAWESSKTQIEAVVNDVICSVKESYYNLLYAIAKKQVALETVEQYKQMYNQAKAFYEVGTKPKVDVTIASANLSNANTDLIEATNNVDIAVSKLNNAMGLPYVPPYVVDTSIPYQDVDISMKEAVEIANANRPDLKISLLGIEQANQYVKLAKKSYFPSLEFRGNWSMGGRDDLTETNWYDMGGYLSFPVINPFLIRNQIVQAKALYEQEKYNTKSTVNDVYYEIQQSYVRLVDAKERIPSSKLTVKEAKESYDLSKGRYRVGVCDAIELRDAQIQYANAKLAYISALYAYNSAKAQLERAIGQTIKPLETPEKIEI